MIRYLPFMLISLILYSLFFYHNQQSDLQLTGNMLDDKIVQKEVLQLDSSKLLHPENKTLAFQAKVITTLKPNAETVMPTTDNFAEQPEVATSNTEKATKNKVKVVSSEAIKNAEAVSDDVLETTLDAMTANAENPIVDNTEVTLDLATANVEVPIADSTEPTLDLATTNIETPIVDNTEVTLDLATANVETPIVDSAKPTLDLTTANVEAPIADDTKPTLDLATANVEAPIVDSAKPTLDLATANVEAPIVDNTEPTLDLATANVETPIVDSAKPTLDLVTTNVKAPIVDSAKLTLDLATANVEAPAVESAEVALDVTPITGEPAENIADAVTTLTTGDLAEQPVTAIKPTAVALTVAEDATKYINTIKQLPLKIRDLQAAIKSTPAIDSALIKGDFYEKTFRQHLSPLKKKKSPKKKDVIRLVKKTNVEQDSLSGELLKHNKISMSKEQKKIAATTTDKPKRIFKKQVTGLNTSTQPNMQDTVVTPSDKRPSLTEAKKQGVEDNVIAGSTAFNANNANDINTLAPTEKPKRSFKKQIKASNTPIQSGRQNAIAVSGNTPQYPDEAKNMGLEGDVTAKFIVNMQGKAKQAQIILSSGHQILDNALLEFVSKERFMPALEGTEKVTREQQLPYKYKL